jgi:hypothetical protein
MTGLAEVVIRVSWQSKEHAKTDARTQKSSYHGPSQVVLPM